MREMGSSQGHTRQDWGGSLPHSHLKWESTFFFQASLLLDLPALFHLKHFSAQPPSSPGLEPGGRKVSTVEECWSGPGSTRLHASFIVKN